MLAASLSGGFGSGLVGLFGGGLAETVTTILTQYGYLAVLLFVFAETSMLFPFLPSELVVPAAAVLLVSGPLSFVAFVCVTIVGATLGSLFAYYAFGSGSSRLVDRFGSRIQVSESEIERSRRWFRRWGEFSVFWGRLLPGFRSLISIPAGFAGMDVRKFALYSGTGNGVFAAGVAGLVLVGGDGRLLDALFALGRPLAVRAIAAARTAPVFAFAAFLLCLFGVLLARNVYTTRFQSP